MELTMSEHQAHQARGRVGKISPSALNKRSPIIGFVDSMRKTRYCMRLEWPMLVVICLETDLWMTLSCYGDRSPFVQSHRPITVRCPAVLSASLSSNYSLP